MGAGKSAAMAKMGWIALFRGLYLFEFANDCTLHRPLGRARLAMEQLCRHAEACRKVLVLKEVLLHFISTS